MKSFLLLLIGLVATNVNGLYFFLERDVQKCFKDELVKNTVRHHFNRMTLLSKLRRESGYLTQLSTN